MQWLIILGLINSIFIIIGTIWIIPKKTWKTTWLEYQKIIISQILFIIIIIGVVLIHLIEVNSIDLPLTTTMGTDYTFVFQAVEDHAVFWFMEHWIPPLVYFFVFIYIGLYPFTLWFSPFYFLLTNNRRAMKIFAYSLLTIYAIALPFYLFFPITNVYTYYGAPSALTQVIPDVESFFYTTTTTNNCFPSLHVALSLLVVQTVNLTKNKRYTILTYATAICVICSVIYLAIHWITDVLGGAILSLAVFTFIKGYIKET